MEKMCNHNPSDINNTLIKTAKLKMIHPEIIEYFCKNCNKIYKFTKQNNNFI